MQWLGQGKKVSHSISGFARRDIKFILREKLLDNTKRSISSKKEGGAKCFWRYETRLYVLHYIYYAPNCCTWVALRGVTCYALHISPRCYVLGLVLLWLRVLTKKQTFCAQWHVTLKKKTLWKQTYNCMICVKWCLQCRRLHVGTRASGPADTCGLRHVCVAAVQCTGVQTWTGFSLYDPTKPAFVKCRWRELAACG